MRLPYFLYGLSSPLGGPRRCSTAVQKKARRAAAGDAAFVATVTTAAAAAAAVLLLLLSHTVTYLFSGFLRKHAVLRDADRSSFFSIRDVHVFVI